MNSTALDRVLGQAVADGAVPGVVAGITDANGIRHLSAHGLRDTASGAAMQPDTLFWIASMTKAITSVATMQAVERGRLALDAPAGDYFPAIAAPKVLEGFDDRGAAILRPAARPITARHLLTHTAGYGYDTWNPEILRANAALEIARRPISDAELAKTPLLFDPGTRWNYSIGTDVLGRVLEQSEGRSLTDLLRDSITGPLGMADTGFLLSREQKSRMVSVHRRANGDFAAHGPAAFGDGQGYAGGGGGLVSSVPDYLTFLRALLNRGVGLIRPESWAEMIRNQVAPLRAGQLRTAMPTMSFDADFFPGQPTGWGLGFLMNLETSASGRSPGGLCWAGSANTYYWLDPTRGLAGVVATQMLQFADLQVIETLFAYERAAYAG